MYEQKLVAGRRKIGITAGASAPDILVDELVNYLKINMNTKVSVMPDGFTENVQFKYTKW